jgi:hypothetical protein
MVRIFLATFLFFIDLLRNNNIASERHSANFFLVRTFGTPIYGLGSPVFFAEPVYPRSTGGNEMEPTVSGETFRERTAVSSRGRRFFTPGG